MIRFETLREIMSHISHLLCLIPMLMIFATLLELEDGDEVSLIGYVAVFAVTIIMQMAVTAVDNITGTEPYVTMERGGKNGKEY